MNSGERPLDADLERGESIAINEFPMNASLTQTEIETTPKSPVTETSTSDPVIPL
jgi:hypothetical protein